MKKPIRSALSALLLCLLLTACSGAAATPDPGQIETIVAATFQALTLQPGNVSPATEPPPVPTDTPPAPTPTPAPPTPTLLPTAIPAQVLPPGAYMPYAADRCEQMRINFEQAIGAPVTIETAAFSDRMTGGTGTACRVLATGTGVTYGMAGPFNTLHTLLLSLGWTEDFNYGAAGPRGMMDGYRNGGALGLLSVGWQPAAGVTCPPNQPISSCPLTAEQKAFTVTFDVVQVVVYNPLPAEQCAGWLIMLQSTMPVTLVPETVEFYDLSGNYGTACQARGAGTGVDFASMPDAANALGNLFSSSGWALVNGADGPTGTVRVYTYGNQIAVVTVSWRPSADANCPNNQPISSCNLLAEQRLFSVKVALAQK